MSCSQDNKTIKIKGSDTEVNLDYAAFSKPLEFTIIVGFTFAAVLISGSFFAASAENNITKPTPLISIPTSAFLF